jgi:hypothetical protein
MDLLALSATRPPRPPRPPSILPLALKAGLGTVESRSWVPSTSPDLEAPSNSREVRGQGVARSG